MGFLSKDRSDSEGMLDRFIAMTPEEHKKAHQQVMKIMKKTEDAMDIIIPKLWGKLNENTKRN